MLHAERGSGQLYTAAAEGRGSGQLHTATNRARGEEALNKITMVSYSARLVAASPPRYSKEKSQMDGTAFLPVCESSVKTSLSPGTRAPMMRFVP